MQKLLRWLPAIFLCAYIFYWSSLPGSTINDLGLGNEAYHRIGHFLMFFFLCLTFYYATKNVVLSILLTVLYALSDEFHQSFVPLRSASIFDIYVDTLGALTAGGLWKLYRIVLQKLKN